MLRAVWVTIQWICRACGAVGEIKAELPCDTLADLSIEMAAATLVDALRAVPHLHPVGPHRVIPS